MLFNKLTSAIIAAASMSLAAADDFPTIDVVGNKFFYSNNGSQFYIRGVAYQADVTGEDNDTFVDPLADATTCKRDLPYLTEINTNVLRVYALDTSADHDACMQLFQDAGIYIIADLAEPTLSIATTDPEWTVELYERYTSVIDMMQGYDNVLGFFAGNEVITNNTNTDAAPFVKAAIRDMKSYISDKGYRSIPVGYSANDDSKTRVGSADYFSCGDDEVKADFYGINMYEWCGSSNFKTSGYEDRTEDFANLTIPAFFSEYGCNAVTPRKFTEIGTLFSDEMTDVWSGGIVYMYFEEVNNYGLVSEIDSSSVSTMADFQYYSSEMNAISPTSAKSSDISTSASQLACPTSNANWKAATQLPPTPQQGTCDCMYDSLSCVIDSDVDEDDYADLFDYVCNEIDCDGISKDGKTGTYGSYSFCSPKEQLSFVLNLYYNDQGGDSSACDFSGSASLVTGTTYKSCATVLSEAGVSGLGSITASVSATKTDSTSTKESKESKTTDSASSDSSSSNESSSTKSSKTTASSVSSISSTSKGDAANAVGSSFVMGFAGVVAALFL